MWIPTVIDWKISKRLYLDSSSIIRIIETPCICMVSLVIEMVTSSIGLGISLEIDIPAIVYKTGFKDV